MAHGHPNITCNLTTPLNLTVHSVDVSPHVRYRLYRVVQSRPRFFLFRHTQYYRVAPSVLVTFRELWTAIRHYVQTVVGKMSDCG